MAKSAAKAEKAATPDAGEGEGEAAPKKSKKKLILIAVPVLLIAIGAGGWFSGIIPKLLHGEEKAEAKGKAGGKEGAEAKDASAAPPPPVFVDLPEMVTNLNVATRKQSYAKLHAKLELEKAEDVAPVQAALPRIQDLFQTYLRDMRPEELRGSSGSYRLREELLDRATVAVAPARVRDVLFVELLIE